MKIPSSIRWVIEIWTRHPWMFLTLLLFGILSGLVGAAEPILLKTFIDGIGKSGEHDLLNVERSHFDKFAIFFIIFGSVQFFANLYPGIRGWMNHKLEMIIRDRVFRKLLDKGPGFFFKYRSGDILTRLTDDLSGFPKTAWFMSSGIFRAFNAFCVLFFSSIMMFVLNWKLALMAYVLMPLGAIIFLRFHRQIRDAFDRRQKMVSETNNHLESCLSGISILKSCCAENRVSTRFREILSDRVDRELEVVGIEAFFSSFFPNLSFASQLVVVFFGGYLVMEGKLSMGEFYAFFTYLSQLVYHFIDIAMFFVTGRQAMVSVNRLVVLETDGPVLPHLGGDESLSESRSCGIAIRGATILSRQDSDRRMISDINCMIEPGEWIAMVGSVGSGKTTLLKLLAGMMDPDEGSVEWTLNDHGCGEHANLPRIGFVDTEPMVFTGSIRDNVDFFRALPDDRVQWACDVAQLKTDLEEFTDGLEQIVGEKGVTLSGGQRQRVAMARAIAGRPDLLLLDDVTSSLDAENEARLIEALKGEMPGVTCLFATHRPRAARLSDQVFFIRQGTIVEKADHGDLLAGNSDYRNLMEIHPVSV
ncbi:MAG: hypothetical protein CVV64_08175 [Candidatus Wallbacteria bacterium HGW-Wallbacteria-1]|jgi:ATP-binding cassette subfamily B protein|uniref:ABC transporter ATP-binding protein n=1 Tax=Candidatus Wallbacteria bacterium HGW-Wallbacteria-1 TaxID=2013854 RepID=A0A2N1PRA4_9BACT|nr:MAG: hypothetical protein CVV64_08175 [Candidatus Wallbacteria bacterium HGW-Wallbacteria-1]